ncbi:AAA family ATPase [bacterium]|nr:AAA family ATPase [bacterium]
MSNSTKAHPFCNFVDAYPTVIETTEFVLDGVLAAGTVVIAGERGLGKTSALVPLMASVAGLCPELPLKSLIQRTVIYVAEDPLQVTRILRALRENGHIQATSDEIRAGFKLVPATRLSPSEIVDIKRHIEPFIQDNKTADGGNYRAPPVIVLDTTNATIDLENISDNSQVSKAVSELRNGLGDIPIILVGHIAKASRGIAKQMSFVGAGSWEGDTQQNLYLVMEDDMRYLVIGKNRFDPEVKEYALHSHQATMVGKNKLGYTEQLRCFYSIPEPMSPEGKFALKAKEAKQKRFDSDQQLMEDLLEVIVENPGMSATAVKSKISGKADRKHAALEQLERDDRIIIKSPDKRTRTYYPVAPF